MEIIRLKLFYNKHRCSGRDVVSKNILFLVLVTFLFSGAESFM